MSKIILCIVKSESDHVKNVIVLVDFTIDIFEKGSWLNAGPAPVCCKIETKVFEIDFLESCVIVIGIGQVAKFFEVFEDHALDIIYQLKLFYRL